MEEQIEKQRSILSILLVLIWCIFLVSSVIYANTVSISLTILAPNSNDSSSHSNNTDTEITTGSTSTGNNSTWSLSTWDQTPYITGSNGNTTGIHNAPDNTTSWKIDIQRNKKNTKTIIVTNHKDPEILIESGKVIAVGVYSSTHASTNPDTLSTGNFLSIEKIGSIASMFLIKYHIIALKTILPPLQRELLWFFFCPAEHVPGQLAFFQLLFSSVTQAIWIHL